MKTVKIKNSSSPQQEITAKYCDSFWSKFLGLMFSRELDNDFGLFFVENKESRANTSIHMMFVNYDITVLWLNKNMAIVDKVLARKWAPIYIPKKAAQYILELHRAKFPDYSVGDTLMIVEGN